MKDSMVNSTNEKAAQNSSLKRLKTFTDLSQTPETTALSGEAESAGSISAINPIDLLVITTHVQAASSLPMNPPPFGKRRKRGVYEIIYITVGLFHTLCEV